MSKVSTADLFTMRRYPQETELKLSIFRPTVALACRVNEALIQKGERDITYGSVTAGSYLNINNGMTMLVGSTPGGFEYGTIRVRSATNAVLTVAENSHIQWQNNMYLTVLNFYDIVPVFPRIVKTTGKEEVTFYKDYDIAYTNQNKINGTFICMGSHREAELNRDDPDVLGTCRIYYTSSGTYNVNDKSLTYLWSFEGGTPTGSTSATPGWITYTAPGFYITKLQVTAADGAVDVSYRYIIINAPDSGVVRDWQINSMQQSKGTGGMVAGITIFSPLEFTLTPGTVMILFTKERYGGNIQRSIGGTQFQENIFFVGYVMDGTITYNYEKGRVDFQLGNVTEIMKMATGFAISVEDSTDDPTVWYQMQNLNLRKALYHYLRWHSTVLFTCDFQYIGSDFKQQFFDSNKESLYDAVNSAMKSTRIGDLTSDRMSKLWAEISQAATPHAVTSFQSEIVISNNDWIGDPNITFNENPDVAYLEMGGIYYKGGGSEHSVPLLACAPGRAPSNRGKHSAQTGLSLQGQGQLNNLVGDIFYNNNYYIQRVRLNMRGTFKNFDIAPQKAATLNIPASDTPKNIAISGTFIPIEVSWKYDHSNFSLNPVVTFAPVTDGPPGETIDVPPVPPNGPTIKIPPFPKIRYPEIPGPGHIEPIPPLITPLGLIVIHVDNEGVFALDTINTPTAWFAVTTPFDWTLAEIDNIAFIGVDPYGKLFTSDNIGNIYSQTILTVTPRVTICNSATFYSLVEKADGWPALVLAMGVSKVAADTVAISGYRTLSILGGNRSVGLISTSGGTNSLKKGFHYDEGGADAYSGGMMFYNYSTGMWTSCTTRGGGLVLQQFTGDMGGFGSPREIALGSAQGGYYSHAQSEDGSTIFTPSSNGSLGKAGIVDARAFTFEGVIYSADSRIARYNGAACDPSGQYVFLALQNNQGGGIGKYVFSSDGGETFGSPIALPSISWDNRAPTTINNNRVMNLGDPDSWVISFNGDVQIDPGVDISQCLHIFQTADGGDTWEDIAENIRGLVPASGQIVQLDYA